MNRQVFHAVVLVTCLVMMTLTQQLSAQEVLNLDCDNCEEAVAAFFRVAREAGADKRGVRQLEKDLTEVYSGMPSKELYELIESRSETNFLRPRLAGRENRINATFTFPQNGFFFILRVSFKVDGLKIAGVTVSRSFSESGHGFLPIEVERSRE